MSGLSVGWMTLPEFLHFCESCAIGAGLGGTLIQLVQAFRLRQSWVHKLGLMVLLALVGAGFFWRVSTPWR